MDKINRFIRALVLKMTVTMCSVVKELMYPVFKLFCITSGSMYSFRIRSLKERLGWNVSFKVSSFG